MSHPSNAFPQTSDEIKQLLASHPATLEQTISYAAIRAAAETLVKEIAYRCPSCADRTAALRKVREAVMTANASIALTIKE